VIALSVVAVALLGCCGIGTAVAAPFLGEYPATVAAPSRVAGLDQVRNAEVDRIGQQLADELKKNSAIDNAVAGLYAPGGDQGHAVLVVGATGLIFSPRNEVDNALRSMGDGGIPVTGVKDYDPGALGGTVRCGTGSIRTVSLSICGWADHGSVGVGIFYDRPLADSADLFLRIREGMVKR
jgi:hypothetical protein